MDNFLIGIVILFGLMFLSRIINEKALKRLDRDKKIALIDLFSGQRIYAFAILFTLIVLFIINTKFELIEPSTAFVLYFGLLFLYIIVKSYLSYRTLKKNEFPSDYIKSFLLSTVVVSIGLLLFFALLFQLKK